MDIGTHIVADLFEIPTETFTKYLSKENYDIFDEIIEKTLRENNMTLLNKCIHHFEHPNFEGAFTSIYLLSESHLSLHSWPEHEYIAMDVFTCGDGNAYNIVNEIIHLLKPGNISKKVVERGIPNKQTDYDYDFRDG